MEKFHLKRCYVLLERLSPKGIDSHSHRKRPRKNPNVKRKSSKATNKRLLEVNDNSELKDNKVKKSKVEECEIILTSKYNSSGTHNPTNSKNLTLISTTEKKEDVTNSRKLLLVLVRTNPCIPNLQNKNVKTTNEVQKLNEYEKQAYEVRKNVQKNTQISTKEKSETDHLEQTKKTIDSTSCALEVKENNPNNCNLCVVEKSQSENQCLSKDQQDLNQEIESVKQEAIVEENNTNGLCFNNLEEKNIKDENLEQTDAEELPTNNYFEQSLLIKENNQVSDKIVLQVINESKVDNLAKTEQEPTSDESVKREIDDKAKNCYKRSFSHEEDNKTEVKILQQIKSELVEQSNKFQENIMLKIKLMKKSKSINKIFDILSRKQKINNDKNYININFYHSSFQYLGKISSRKGLNEIRSIYMFYFNEVIEPVLAVLSSALSSAAQVLLSHFNEVGEKSSQDVDFYLSGYSALFVQTFESIQCQFLEPHRSFMITVLYLQFLKEAAKNVSFKPGTLKRVAAKLFKMENYRNSYDKISNSSHRNAKTILQFFGKWLGKIFVGPDLTIDGHFFSNLFLNCKDKIKNAVVKEEDQELISSTRNFQPFDLHTSLNEVQSGLDFTINKEIEMILDFYNNHHTEENHRHTSFVIDCLEGVTGDNCSNIESCNKRKVVPCLFCYELVCCTDFCEVQGDQLVYISSDKYEYKTCVTCPQHKSFSWNEDMYKVWNEVEDDPMLYNPICWNVTCEKRAKVVCICKAKAYCSLDCQVEDWEDNHSDYCTRKPHPDLLWSPSEKNSILSQLEV